MSLQSPHGYCMILLKELKTISRQRNEIFFKSVALSRPSRACLSIIEARKAHKQASTDDGCIYGLTKHPRAPEKRIFIQVLKIYYYDSIMSPCPNTILLRHYRWRYPALILIFTKYQDYLCSPQLWFLQPIGHRKKSSSDMSSS